MLRTEHTCHYIDWLVPKLLRQMETSDIEHLKLVMAALMAIFQNFIKVNETNHDHLKKLREMIVGAAIRVLHFFYLKGDTFEIEEGYMAVITALSHRCRIALLEVVSQAAKDNFFRVKPKVAQTYSNALFLVMPEQTTEILVRWIKDKVVVPCHPPAKWGNTFLLRLICFRSFPQRKWN